MEVYSLVNGSISERISVILPGVDKDTVYDGVGASFLTLNNNTYFIIPYYKISDNGGLEAGLSIYYVDHTIFYHLGDYRLLDISSRRIPLSTTIFEIEIDSRDIDYDQNMNS
jgi:hypothetical protein